MNRQGLCGWLAGAALLAAGMASAQAAEPYPPFSVKQPDGQWTGFEPDLIHKVCAEMKAQCEIDEVAWDGIIPALMAKKIDVIFNSMSITDEREKQIAFSVPYYDTQRHHHQPRGPEGQGDRRADLHRQLQLPEEVLREDRRRALLRHPGLGERRPGGRAHRPDDGRRHRREILPRLPRRQGRRHRQQGRGAPRPAVRPRRGRRPAQGRHRAEGQARRGHRQAAGQR